MQQPEIHTFTIVAWDAETQAWGIATASKYLAVGAFVPHARADVGAIATQATGRMSYGIEGLRLLADGVGAADALRQMVEADAEASIRQVGIIDRTGHVAVHTGRDCMEWAGHRVGENHICLGNLLTGADVLGAMQDTFTSSRQRFAERLISALRAADTAGGDRRGRQAAALLVVRAGGGPGGDNDRYIDLRVDDDAQPIKKLEDLLRSHRVFFQVEQTRKPIEVDSTLARELQTILLKQGYLGGEPDGIWDVMSHQAFSNLVDDENLEDRWTIDNPNEVDPVLLDYLRQRFETTS